MTLQDTGKRDTTISICKALGIILMVITHSGSPGKLCAFAYEFHMPLFFITAGYFFSLRYLNDEATFIKKRIKGLYIPFLKWSVFFLVIHNWMFSLGILNEKFGNLGGGVTHPYSWHQIQQNLWNMVTAMGGYDQFLNGAFWFFRALFIASIFYLVLFKICNIIARKLTGTRPNTNIVAVAVCVAALALAAWKTGEGLRVTNLIQGGYREIMGTFFFGCGFLFRQMRDRYKITWWTTFVFAITTFLFSRFASSAMAWNANFTQFVSLPIPAICGFLMTYNISFWISRGDGWLRRFLTYCGDNTLSIFVFHLLAFKIVSLVKIWWYGLDYLQIGCHPVIHDFSRDDWFWIPYTIVGVGIPLVINYLAGKIKLQMKSPIK